MVSIGIVGLGYVGLPLAREIAFSGLSCRGIDSDESRVAALQTGLSHIDDVSNEDLIRMLRSGFVASTDVSVLSQVDAVVICVPTPLSVEGGPDLAAVRQAANSIATILKPGQLIVLESTTYPGTTEEVLIPLLQRSGLRAGIDFNVAFSPERVDPGNQNFRIRNTPKVVGGFTESCAQRAASMYEQFIETVVVARGLREAEMTKLLENTYRHVNIALVNELSHFCHILGIDLWDSIRCASSKPFGFEPFYPGPGVGGHCIPIDPNYLSHHIQTHIGQPFRFVELAQEINQAMPAYVARRAQDLLNSLGKAVKSSKVLLVGITYKANVADLRETPAYAVAQTLLAWGAELEFSDPYVEEWKVNDSLVARSDDLASSAVSADLVILLQNHARLGTKVLQDLECVVLDTRGVLSGHNIERL